MAVANKIIIMPEDIATDNTFNLFLPFEAVYELKVAMQNAGNIRVGYG